MKKRYTNLDFLKALCAVLIVLHHYQQMTKVRFQGINFYDGEFYLGYLVELFFMISGFVMAISDNKEKSVFQRYFGKCIRIYPSAMLACSAMIIMGYVGYIVMGEWVDKSTNYTNVLTIITSYLLVFRGWFFDVGLGINNVTWYLCVLLLCYVIYYLIENISKQFNISKIVMYFSVVIISFWGLYYGKSFPMFFSYYNQRGYICFFIGILLYDFFIERFSNRQKCIAIILLSLLTIMGIYQFGMNTWIVLDIFLYPLLTCLMILPKQLPACFSILGGQAYEVYLWHVPCFVLLKLIGKIFGIQITHSYITMIAFLIFVEIVAVLIYEYIEIPIIRNLKKNF